MIVGKMIGNNAFAAVSVANPIMSVVLFFLVGLSMGVGILLAQWYGAQDIKMFKVQYSTALIAGCVFTVAASLLCIVCSRWMLLAANTPAEIMEDTNWYLRIIFAGLFSPSCTIIWRRRSAPSGIPAAPFCFWSFRR